MKLVGLMTLAALSLTLVAAAPVYAQEPRDQQEEQNAKPEEKAQPAAKQDEKNAQQEDKNTKQEEKNTQQQDKNSQAADKNTKQEEKNAQQQAKPAQQAQRAGGNGGGGIPADRFKANFGREHSFRVSQTDYRNRRFQYGGYTFGFVDAWPSNWLYTQDVFVVEINGVYYLCNASYPGVKLALSFTL